MEAPHFAEDWARGWLYQENKKFWASSTNTSLRVWKTCCWTMNEGLKWLMSLATLRHMAPRMQQPSTLAVLRISDSKQCNLGLSLHDTKGIF